MNPHFANRLNPAPFQNTNRFIALHAPIKKDEPALNLSIELGNDGDMKVKMNGN